MFDFKIVAFKDLGENLDFVDRFLHFSGKYELHGFGRLDGCDLKMGSTLDGLQGGLTPIWKQDYVPTDSQFFIFFNKTRWELHETKTPFGFSSPISYDHIYCKTGLTNRCLLFYKTFR